MWMMAAISVFDASCVYVRTRYTVISRASQYIPGEHSGMHEHAMYDADETEDGAGKKFR